MKWRGALFQRFLLALVDESRAVRSLAEYLLADTLGSKVLPIERAFTGATMMFCENTNGLLCGKGNRTFHAAAGWTCRSLL